jgi:hypothetical protein
MEYHDVYRKLNLASSTATDCVMAMVRSSYVGGTRGTGIFETVRAPAKRTGSWWSRAHLGKIRSQFFLF